MEIFNGRIPEEFQIPEKPRRPASDSFLFDSAPPHPHASPFDEYDNYDEYDYYEDSVTLNADNNISPVPLETLDLSAVGPESDKPRLKFVDATRSGSPSLKATTRRPNISITALNGLLDTKLKASKSKQRKKTRRRPGEKKPGRKSNDRPISLLTDSEETLFTSEEEEGNHLEPD